MDKVLILYHVNPVQFRRALLVLALWFVPGGWPGVRTGRCRPCRQFHCKTAIAIIHAEVVSPFKIVPALMHRPAFAPEAGMLFVFVPIRAKCACGCEYSDPVVGGGSRRQWAGINIADMRPRSDTVHCAAGPARFVLVNESGNIRRRRCSRACALAVLPASGNARLLAEQGG